MKFMIKRAAATASLLFWALPIMAQTPEVLVNYGEGVLAEGLAFDADGTAYISLLKSKEIRTINPDGSTGLAGQIDIEKGFMPGLAMGPDGAVYGLVNNAPEGTGLWRVVPGEEPTLFANFDPIPGVPNHPTFSNSGEVYVSMSNPGVIYKVSADGQDINLWAESPWITSITIPSLGFKLGANGSVFNEDENILYVSNTSKNLVAKIMLNEDGSAGEISCWFGHDSACEINSGGVLEGNDGLAMTPDGTIFIASGINNRIVSVTQDGYMKIHAEGAPLQYPVIVEFAPDDYDTIYITNLDLMSYFNVLGYRNLQPGAGVLKLNLSE